MRNTTIDHPEVHGIGYTLLGMLFIMTASHGWLNGESHPQSTSTNGRTQGFERFSYCIYLNLSTLCIYIYTCTCIYLHISIHRVIDWYTVYVYIIYICIYHYIPSFIHIICTYTCELRTSDNWFLIYGHGMEMACGDVRNSPREERSCWSTPNLGGFLSGLSVYNMFNIPKLCQIYRYVFWVADPFYFDFYFGWSKLTLFVGGWVAKPPK